MLGRPCRYFLVLLISCCFIWSCKGHLPETSKETVEPPFTNDSVPQPIDGLLSANLVDKSPLDVVYFPVDYPKHKMMGTITGPPVFRVLYSRPHRGGRIIFGNLVKYGEPWRLGANEATEIEFFRAVKVQKQPVPAGKYTLYCIPEADQWTIVFNSDLYGWGLRFNTSKDAFRFTVPVMHDTTPIEYFTIEAQQSDAGADLWFAWDTIKVYLPVNF